MVIIMHTVFQTQCSWLWWDASAENHPRAVGHQYEERRTARFEKGLSYLNSEILWRDGSSTIKCPLPRQKLDASSRGEPVLPGGAGGHSGAQRRRRRRRRQRLRLVSHHGRHDGRWWTGSCLAWALRMADAPPPAPERAVPQKRQVLTLDQNGTGLCPRRPTSLK